MHINSALGFNLFTQKCGSKCFPAFKSISSSYPTRSMTPVNSTLSKERQFLFTPNENVARVKTRIFSTRRNNKSWPIFKVNLPSWIKPCSTLIVKIQEQIERRIDISYILCFSELFISTELCCNWGRDWRKIKLELNELVSFHDARVTNNMSKQSSNWISPNGINPPKFPADLKANIFINHWYLFWSLLLRQRKYFWETKFENDRKLVVDIVLNIVWKWVALCSQFLRVF